LLEPHPQALQQASSSTDSSDAWWRRILVFVTPPLLPCPQCGHLLVRRDLPNPSRASPEAA
jgi:hypothetical protein